MNILGPSFRCISSDRLKFIISKLSLIAYCVNINYRSASFTLLSIVFLDTQAGFILIPKRQNSIASFYSFFQRGKVGVGGSKSKMMNVEGMCLDYA